MRWSHDTEIDIASLDLVDHIADGEIVQDVGPQLTPSRQSITMGYDLAGNLLTLELWAASQILPLEALEMPPVRLRHDESADTARLYFADAEIDDSEVMQVGPQLTPTGDKLILGYDRSDYLVYLDIIGCSRVLRDDTLAAAE